MKRLGFTSTSQLLEHDIAMGVSKAVASHAPRASLSPAKRSSFKSPPRSPNRSPRVSLGSRDGEASPRGARGARGALGERPEEPLGASRLARDGARGGRPAAFTRRRLFRRGGVHQPVRLARARARAPRPRAARRRAVDQPLRGPAQRDSARRVVEVDRAHEPRTRDASGGDGDGVDAFAREGRGALPRTRDAGAGDFQVAELGRVARQEVAARVGRVAVRGRAERVQRPRRVGVSGEPGNGRDGEVVAERRAAAAAAAAAGTAHDGRSAGGAASEGRRRRLRRRRRGS